MRALVRSGCVAANSIDIVPARAPANTIPRSMPTASMTAAMSSRCSSIVGGSGPRSERPTPRMSKSVRRENDASRWRKDAHSGSSHMRSTFDQMPDEYTRSTGPSPTT
jgi:hypothetical protein